MIDGEQRSNRRRSRANGCERWRESLLVISKHEPRSQQIEDAFELGVIPREQRVRWRDGRHGNADVHGAERKQRVIDGIVREHRHRRRRRQAAREQ